MTRDQQTARVNVSDDDWIAFRTLAMRQRRSIADYLAELVRRELEQAAEAPDTQPERSVVEPPPPQRRSSLPVRLADQKLLTSLPRPRPQPPPWEE